MIRMFTARAWFSAGVECFRAYGLWLTADAQGVN